ncbi:hypothetical protein FRC01_001240, partial [Tulasnella sp. 417]
GAFDSFEHKHLPRTKYDEIIDLTSNKPHEQAFEKCISGRYLGEIHRLVMKELIDDGVIFRGQDTSKLNEEYCFDTAYLSTMESDMTPELLTIAGVFSQHYKIETTLAERQFFKALAKLIGTRSARLASCGMAAIVKKLDILDEGCSIGIDGSLYDMYPGFKERIHEGLTDIFGEKGKNVVTHHAEDGSGLGSAIIADLEVLPGASRLQDAVYLPCGLVLPNRLVKAAMYESLADFGGGPPNSQHFKLYSQWGNGGWGMLITGNVQVDPLHLSLGRDLVVPEILSPETVAPYVQLRQAMTTGTNNPRARPLAILQLNHTGRQSPRIIGGRGIFGGPPSAASSVPVRSRDKRDGVVSQLAYWLMFPTPKTLSMEDIDSVIERFVRGAQLAHQAGFDGIELHASHGYLISGFLSPKTNRRTDRYGFPKELTIIESILNRIRATVPQPFALGIKVNAADYVSGSVTEEQALVHIREMASWRMLDFIEISGGDYERPDFGATASPRQAFFAKFSRLALKAIPQGDGMPVIILTGSLRTKEVMTRTIHDGHAHLIGIGRPAVICPSYAKALLEPPSSKAAGDDHLPVDFPDPPSPFWLKMLNTGLIGAGLNTAWHCALMWRIGNDYWNGLAVGRVKGGTLGVPQIGGIQALLELWRPWPSYYHVLIIKSARKSDSGGLSPCSHSYNPALIYSHALPWV